MDYNRHEKLEDYKSSHDLILMLADIVSRGGNLLLDIGPTADGRIPVIMQQRLTDMGNWLQTNDEATTRHPKAYKQPYEWSDGKMQVKKGESFLWRVTTLQIMVKPAKNFVRWKLFYNQRQGFILHYTQLPPQVKVRNLR